jgi:epoxyqueuosine reductase
MSPSDPGTAPAADGLRLKAAIRAAAERLGFSRTGFAAAGACRDGDRLTRWIDAGRHGEMAWMAREPERRSDPRNVLPGARTVISLLTFYPAGPGAAPDAAAPAGPGAAPGEGGGAARVARYALGRDYHNVVGRRLRKLIREVRALAPGAEAIAGVDHRPILEKEWAERAGLGWIGKHTNLITEDAGSWCLLGEVITDLALPPDAGPHPDRCGKCADCIAACPTGAIVAPWQVDARRCISYLTIELRGPIPVELRPLVGEWIFGCDVCQEVCPWNRFAVRVDDPAFRRDAGRWDGPAEQFLEMTEEEFAARFAGSPVIRTGRDGFLRNVCVALGNRGDPAALPALRRALEDGSELVREHAAWAIERIG